MPGRQGKYSYIHTIRKQVGGQVIEVKTPVGNREYSHLLDQTDPLHFTVEKTRRCFMYNSQYFQLDMYGFWKIFLAAVSIIKYFLQVPGAVPPAVPRPDAAGDLHHALAGGLQRQAAVISKR